MNTLLTGANGFLGRNVVELCKTINFLTPKKEDLNLLDLEKLIKYLNENKVSKIINLAALCGGIGINAGNPGKFMYQNLQMGINVLEASRICNIKKLVNIGTVCSYPKFAKVPFQEDQIWDGYPEETNAAYGIAKKTVMELSIAYNKQYSLNVTNLIPVNMCGPHDNFDLLESHVIPALIRKFESSPDQVILWGTGNASREFLDVRDCVEAIKLAINTDTDPYPINLGTGKEIKIFELANMIKKLGNYSANINWDSSKPDGQPRRCLDISRAKRILNWSPKINLEESLIDTIKFYRGIK